MRGEGKSGSKHIEDVEKLRSRKTRLEHLKQDTDKSRKITDGKNQLHQSGIEAAYVAITQIDKNYKILMVKNVPGDCFDKAADELIGRECFREFEKRQSVCSHCPGKRAMETGLPAQTRTERVLDDGRRCPVRIQAFPTINPDGEVAGFFEIIEDITEYINTEEKLRKSKGQLKTLFESTREGLLTANPDGRVVGANPAAARILGYKSAQDLIGMYTSDFYVDKNQRKNVLQELEKKGYVHDVEIVAKKQDGTEAYLLASITIQRDDKGNAIRTNGIFRDITERKKAEMSLRKERDKAQKYLDVADVMLVAVDSEQRVGLINKKGCEILGYEEEEILGKNWFDNFLPERIRPEVREILGKLVRGEPDTRLYRENPILTKSGEERLIAWHNTVLRDEKGIALATLSSGQDITESKEAQEQIVKLARFPAEDPSPVLRVSSDCTVIYANNSSSSLLKAWRCGVGHSLPARWKKIALNALSTGQSHETEVKCDGRTFSMTFAPVMDYNYINVYGLDITKRKKAEEALRQEHNLLRLLIDNMPDEIYVKDTDSRMLLCNQTVAEHHGFLSPSELIDKTDDELYPAEQAEQYRAEEQQIMRSGEPKVNYLEKCHDKRGGEIWGLNTKMPLRDNVGKIIGLVGIGRDVTQEKKAEEALRREHNLLRLLIDNIPDKIYVKDNEHRFIIGNETVIRCEGFQNEEELIGKTDFDLYPKELAESFYAEERGIIEKCQPVINREDLYLDKQGNEEWTLVTKVPLQDEVGDTIGLVGINRSITERKKAVQEQLAHLQFIKNLDQVNRAIQGTNDLEQMMSDVLDVVLSIFDCDRAWLVYPCDPETTSWCAPMERTKPQYPGALALGLDVPIDSDVVRVFRTVLASDGPVQFHPRSEHALPAAVAEQFNEQSQIAMAIYPKVDKPYMFGLHQCSYLRVWTLQEEKQLQEIGWRLADSLTSLLMYRDLRESENKYRELANSITDVFFAMDTDLRYTYWNKASEDLTGIKAEDTLGKTIFEIFPDTEDTRKAAALYQEVLKKKQPKSFENEFRFQDKHYFFEINAYPSEDGISVFAKDITERKQAEEALRTSEARLSDAVKIAKIGYWEYDVAGELFIFNDQFYSVYRTSAEQVGGYKISPDRYAELFLHPDDVSGFQDEIRRVVETTDPYFNSQVEHRFIYGDGKIGYVSVRYFAVKDDQGRTVKTYGANQDITERKKAEDKLKRSKVNLDEAQRISGTGSWEWDTASDTVTWSKGLYDIIGRDPNKPAPTYAEHPALYTPESFERLETAVRKVLNNGIPYNLELDTIREDGEIRKVLVLGEQAYDDAGNIILRGTVQDITERKKAEESLRKSEEHYRMLAETMNDGLTRIDEKGIKVYVNRKCAEIFGYSPGEMLGKHWANFYDEEAREIIEEQLAKRKEGIATPYEVIGTRKDGSKMYLRISPQPLFDENGKYKGSISILTDISEQKQAGREKQLSRTILEISSKHRENGPLLNDIVTEIQKYSDCEAVGLRVLDEDGNIPYEAYVGFSKKFYESESPLSIKSDKCMCINVIKGDTNPELPFYTDGGSFYMNSTTRFLATVSEQDKGSTRNVCNEFGYESVALIPIFLENRIHGLIHLADTRENMVPFDMVRTLERIAKQLGTAIQRVLAEEALIESEERYRDLFNNISSGVAVYEAIDNGKDFIFKNFNRSGEKIDNIKKEQLLGKRVTEIFPDIKRFGLFEVFQRVWKTGKAEHCPVTLYQDERIEGWRDNYVYKLPSGEIVSVYDDVTRRKKAEKELQRLAGFWESIVQNANVYMDVLDENRNVLIWNKAAEKISGYSADEVVGHDKIWQWQYPDSKYRNEVIRKAKNVIEGKEELTEFESVIVTKSGQKRIISWYSKSLKDENGKSIGSVATGIDITDRKKAENQLVIDQTKLKAMASKILMAEEREKRRLAMGLHDNICQKLVFAKLALESSLLLISDSGVKTSLKDACENIGETIHEAESLTFELSNPVLQEFGFIAALEKYLNEEILRKHGIEYEFEKGKRIGSLQDEIKTCLFRVTRELLTNVVKHAQAKKIKISVRRSRGFLNVSIQDDGVGFDATDSEEVSKTRFGLFSVREQLEYIGGFLEIESEPGRGTTAKVVVPLRKKSNNLNSRGK